MCEAVWRISLSKPLFSLLWLARWHSPLWFGEALLTSQLCRKFVFTHCYMTYCMKGNIQKGIIGTFLLLCWVILRGQQIIQAVHSLIYIVAKCHLFSVVTWKDIIKYLQKCEGCILDTVDPTWKKYYSVFEPYYSKVFYTVYIIVFTTLLMNATAYCIINYSELINCNKYCSILKFLL